MSKQQKLVVNEFVNEMKSCAEMGMAFENKYKEFVNSNSLNGDDARVNSAFPPNSVESWLVAKLGSEAVFKLKEISS